jgi:cell wall-associated NlpC family hydrolase
MFRRFIARGHLTVPIACLVMTTMLPLSAATVDAVSSVASLDGDVALYQDATQDASTVEGVESATADSTIADPPATDQGDEPAPTEETVESAATDVATDTSLQNNEALADSTGLDDPGQDVRIDPAPVDPAASAPEVDPVTGESADPASVKDAAPAAVDAVPVVPDPSAATAPQNALDAAGPEPWGEPIATAYIAGTGGDGAPCLTAPDWGAATLTVLGEGEAVPVRAETLGEWQPVDCAGAGGYVHVALITWTPVASSDPVGTGGESPKGKTGGQEAVGEQIVDFALQFQGYPYVYAGEGPYAFDCSGFTMFVIHNTLGIDIPHDMRVQYQMGLPVGRDDLQPGDLVFFQNTLHPGMSHDGIYIGGGQFIHAETESSGVRISDLDAEYYSSRWYGAVRFG